jgi:hypothetical protein
MFTAPILTLLLVGAPNEYTLQWKLKENDIFYNKTSIVMDQTIEAMGQTGKQKITIDTALKFKVKSAREGTTVVEMTYLENKIDAPGLPGVNVGDKLKGISFTATLNDKMEVTKLEGYDKFLDALSEGDENQRKLLKAMMPEATIRQMFGQTFVLAPAKPVAIGDTWNRTDKMALGPLGSVEAKGSFKLDSVKDNIATVTVKGDLSFKAGDGGEGLPFKITKADLKADKFNGTHKFDMKLGRVIETKVEMEMSGTMTIAVAGQSIDAKLSQKMTAVGTISDKNPVKD